MKKYLLSFLVIFAAALGISSNAGAVGYYVPNLAADRNQMIYNVFYPQLFSPNAIIPINETFANSTFNNKSLPFVSQDFSQTRRDVPGDLGIRCDWDDFRCRGSYNAWGYQFNLDLSNSGFSDTNTLGDASDNLQVYFIFTSETQMSSWNDPAGYSSALSGTDTNGDDFSYSAYNNGAYFNDRYHDSNYGGAKYLCSSEGASFVESWSLSSDEIVTRQDSCSSYTIGGYSPLAYLDDTDYYYMVFSATIRFNDSSLSSFTYSDISSVLVSKLFAGISYTNVDSQSWQNLIRSQRGSILTGNTIALDAVYVISPDDTDTFNEAAFADKNGSYAYLRYYEVDYSSQRDRDYNHSLTNLFNFTVINPFTGIFDLFVNHSNCVDIPILASMLHSPESTYCSWWPQTVVNITTPVIALSSTMLLFGFFVSWLRSDAGDASIDNGGTSIKVKGSKK